MSDEIKVVDMAGLRVEDPDPPIPEWIKVHAREAERLELLVLGICHALDLEDWDGFRSLAAAYATNMVHGARTGDTEGAAEGAFELACIFHGLAIAMPFSEMLMSDMVNPFYNLSKTFRDLTPTDGDQD